MSLPESLESDNLRVVGPYDVLCGRDKHSFRNVGNRRFRVTVSLYLTRYTEAQNKSEKSRVIASVVENVRANGGRFLKWSAKRQEWVELDEKHTREKVGHALRDTAVAKMGQSSFTSAGVATSFTGISRRQRASTSEGTTIRRTHSSRDVVGDNDQHDDASDPIPEPQGTQSVNRHSQKLSMHLTPTEVQELFAGVEADQDEDAVRFPRGSFASFTSLPPPSHHSRIRSFESDKLILNMDEVEQLMAAEESAPDERGKWDDVLFSDARTDVRSGSRFRCRTLV
jgi:hypothetical protein